MFSRLCETTWIVALYLKSYEFCSLIITDFCRFVYIYNMFANEHYIWAALHVTSHFCL